jgi:hypothetical protein
MVNKFVLDHQQPPIAKCELLADARQGLAICRQRVFVADARLPLPPHLLSTFYISPTDSANP